MLLLRWLVILLTVINMSIYGQNSGNNILKDEATLNTNHATPRAVFASTNDFKAQHLIISFDIDKGWRLYGQAHKDTAPKVTLQLPEGIKVGDPHWTKPEKIEVLGETISGYAAALTIVYPVFSNHPVTPADIIGIKLEWVACNEKSCQPGAKNIKVSYDNQKTFNPVIENSPINWTVILFALIGGVILNFMPCVLPVLSLKIISLTKTVDRAVLKKSGIFFTLGTLVSFWSLASILLTLQYLGNEIGWGFQLQSPYFVIIMIGVFFILSLSLFGVFELGTSFLTLSNKVKNHSHAMSSFFNGVLACLVATPCTAPFMGTALGVAFTQSWYMALFIFTSLGIGMALPFLIITMLPSGYKFLPKPGRWMESFKQFLGFGMAGSVVWLLGVLRAQTNDLTMLTTMYGLILIALGSWVLGRWATIRYGLWQRILVKIIATLLIITGIGSGLIGEQCSQTDCEESICWQEYNPKKIEQYKNEGKIVFIDFTASWCITCQFNKKFVLESKETTNLLKKHDVIMIRADWTSKDKFITKALQHYKRNSVPLYVMHFGNNNTAILPELLSKDIIKNVLNNNIFTAKKSSDDIKRTEKNKKV